MTAPCWQGLSRICKVRPWQVQPSPWPTSLMEGGGAIPLTHSWVPTAKHLPNLSPEAGRSGEAADVSHWQPPKGCSMHG